MQADVAPSADDRWWDGGLIYHVYVRSFFDSDGDGFGDLPGVTAKLDHLAWLGADAVWLSPTMPSPDADWGYDVADYYSVHPELGTEDDLDELVREAGRRGIRVLLDLVPNHTSDAHPWFVESRRSAADPKRDWYVWADPAPGGGPPNNWIDATGEPAWTLDPATGQYYLHNFLPGQPDLNWWRPEVHEEFLRILRHWFDRGIAGFRIDVAQALYKDRELGDDPPAPRGPESPFGLMHSHSMNQPEVHQVYRDWRAVADSYRPPRLLLGETWVVGPERLAAFYGHDDELQLGFNFGFVFSELVASRMKEVVRSTLSALPDQACPVWVGSNHDVSRLATRWAGGDRRKARLALAVLCCLPGALVLYYGDELLLGDVVVPPDQQRDPMTWRATDRRFNRDRARTPMPWTEGPNIGFCPEGVTPWLPCGDRRGSSVEAQLGNPESDLWYARRLLAQRRPGRHSRDRRYEELPSGADQWVFRCGGTVLAANLADGDATVTVPVPAGPVGISNLTAEDRLPAEGGLRLQAWEAVVFPGPAG